VKRGLIGVALLIGGLLGLFMTGCGGYFTLWGLGIGGGSGGMQGFLAVSIPSLIVGVLLLLFVKRRVEAQRTSDAP
jgi:hypothetical protein